jgi:hypothetical protein
MKGGKAAPKIIQYGEKESLTQLLWAIVACQVSKRCYLGVYQIK